MFTCGDANAKHSTRRKKNAQLKFNIIVAWNVHPLRVLLACSTKFLLDTDRMFHVKIDLRMEKNVCASQTKFSMLNGISKSEGNGKVHIIRVSQHKIITFLSTNVLNNLPKWFTRMEKQHFSYFNLNLQSEKTTP